MKTQDEIRGEVLQDILEWPLENIDLQGQTFSDKEIGDIITRRLYADNLNAQLASLMKWQVKILALLCQIPNMKPIVKAVFASEIAELEELSTIRVATWLTAVDLTFLD